jgi:SAM-dependent methyltransferase
MTAGRSADVGLSTAAAMLSRVDLSSSATLFLIGFGQGYALDVLEQVGWQGSVVAFAADAATVDSALERRDFGSWLTSGRLTILRGPDYEGADRLSTSLTPDIEKPLIALDPAAMQSHRDSATHAARLAVKAWFGARANQAARRETAGTYLVNTLRNVSAIAEGADVSSLNDLFAGVPAVVVGAGPSLDRNIAGIQTYRDRVLVVAVDTALRPLLAAGVQPDLVVAVDPSEANAAHLTCLPPCPDTYFVSEGSIDPAAIQQFAGRTFFFRVADHHPWPWLRQLGIERARLRAWGSVLTTAFDLALSMGCNPVMLAGADLAFTGGRPYARGTTYEEMWYREAALGRRHEDIWASQLAAWPEVIENGVDGSPVRTAPHLRSFRDWIATEAARRPDRLIINVSGSGILMGAGIKQVTLGDALKSMPVLDAATRCRIPHVYRSMPTRASSVEALMRARAGGINEDTLSAWHSFALGTVAKADLLCTVEGKARTIALAQTPSAQYRIDAASLQAVRDYVAAAKPVRMLAVDPTAAAYATEVKASASDCKLDASGSAQPAPLVIMTCTDPGASPGPQIEEAWSRVAPGGRLFVLDHTGSRGGAAIRRALLAFFERHPETVVYHGRFFDPHWKMSWIERTATAVTAEPDLDKFHPFHDGIARRLTPLFIEHFKPTSMLDIGCGPGYWLRTFEANGVTDVSGAEDAALLATAGTPAPAGVWSGDLAAFEPSRKVDLCLCIGAARRMPAATAEAVVAACTRASDTVVFSSSLPCMGPWAGYINQQPWSAWHRLFLSHGYLPHDELRPQIEARWPRYLSSTDFLVTVYRRAPIEALSDASATIVLDAAARIDDQVMPTQWYRKALDAATEPAATGLAGMRCEWLEIPASRMMDAGRAGLRRFQFRTSAASFALGRFVPAVSDADRSLHRVGDASEIKAGGGQYTVAADGVIFTAADDTDPRHNGRAYAVRVPAHVAWLERLPMTTIVEQGL